MNRRNWKTWVPRSPAEAMSGVAELAMTRHNRGIERLATDHLGQHNASTLYKWMGNGRLPLTLVLPFENACGQPLITRYLAAAHGQLLVNVPSGRVVTPTDVQQLQQLLNEAVGAVLSFSAGRVSVPEALDAIRAGLESLAWHHGNVQQHDRPQLDFGGSDDE
ncbi:hypothetical protein B6S59_25305 [Pseudomonas sp. A46]|nr:hypothetical protein [Pseudomonas sp. A46]OWJ91092.1 hypothetical protein B6S59_25305 [Pseudomonas sp. A46]